LDDDSLAQINADYALCEVHQNMGDDGCFVAYDFSYTTDANRCIRPQLRASAVLREMKKNGMVCWDTLHIDRNEEGRDTHYSLDSHENI